MAVDVDGAGHGDGAAQIVAAIDAAVGGRGDNPAVVDEEIALLAVDAVGGIEHATAGELGDHRDAPIRSRIAAAAAATLGSALGRAAASGRAMTVSAPTTAPAGSSAGTPARISTAGGAPKVTSGPASATRGTVVAG